MSMRLTGGRAYSIIVQANSAYEAALAFKDHCEKGPPEMGRPKPDYEAVLEVKPIYRVKMRDAIMRRVEKQSRLVRPEKPAR